MKRNKSVGVGILGAWLVFAQVVPAQTAAAEDRAELAKALGAAKVSLQQGLAAGEAQGQPISGKFELEHGQLQLSVYTAKGGTFAEVIVDHNTGKVAKTEDITSGDDYTAAKEQAAAMAKTKRSLGAAIDQAVKSNAGFKAVSAYPSLKDGHPVAEVTLVKGQEFTTVTQTLE
jgi:uncharacterized membrane protein YkoI